MRVSRFAEEAAGPEGGHNVCGVLVHAEPSKIAVARRALLALPGVEVHVEGPDGRIVITVEDADGAPASATLCRLPELEGVASAALVYHHCETDDTSEEKPS